MKYAHDSSPAEAPFEGLTVILATTGPCSLWDAETGARIARLEEKMEGAHVTIAALDRGGPRLVDALRAAEFVGSREVVLVVPPQLGALRWHIPGSRLPVRVLWTLHDDEIPGQLCEALSGRAA